MKKLIIAAFTIALTAVVHAATVSWSATNIAQSTSGSTSYYAMLIDASTTSLTTSDAVAKAIASGTFDGTVMWEGSATYNTSKQVVNVVASNKALPSTYLAGADITYMSIVFDAATTTDAKYYLATSGNEAAAGSISAAGLLQLTQGTQAGKTWTEVVPEPTSALMLLVGLAGLALKRKVA